MARLGGGNDFDVTDITGAPVDTLDAILDVAVEVLGEYGPTLGQTRIERLSRWVVLRVGEQSQAAELEARHQLTVKAGGPYDDDRVWLAGAHAAMTADDARASLPAATCCRERRRSHLQGLIVALGYCVSCGKFCAITPQEQVR